MNYSWLIRFLDKEGNVKELLLKHGEFISIERVRDENEKRVVVPSNDGGGGFRVIPSVV